MTANRSAPPDLVDRDSELQRIERALAEKGSLCVIVGEAGMGKTRLATEVADMAAARGFFVGTGYCWETVDTPALWPWIQVLEQINRAGADTPTVSTASTVAELQAHLAAFVSASGAEAATARAELVQALTGVLSQAAIHTPLLIVLEDLHAADETSLLALRFASTALRGARVALVVTYDEVAVEQRPTLARLLREVTRAGERIDLRPLDRRGIEQVYERLTGEEPSESTLDALAQSTEGNPLFVEESVRLLLAEGDLHRPDESVGFRVPGGVRDVVASRLAMLPDATHGLLTVAAVIGRRFDSGTLARIVRVEVDEVLQSLEPGLDARLLEEAGVLGDFKFKHILIRETLYESLSVSRRMKLHREVAEVLEQSGYEPDELRLTQLAHHWFKAAQAGDPKKTVEYALQAGDGAAAGGANEEAARLYQRALKILEGLPTERARRREVEAKLRAVRGDKHSPRTGSGENVFRREGDYWTIEFGARVTRLKDSKGLRHIAALLSRPGHELHALDLAVTAGTRPPVALPKEVPLDLGGGDAVLDEVAKRQFRRRMEQLHEEMEEGARFNDPVRRERARAELEELQSALANAVGLGGRDRRLASPAERARISVTKTIRDALGKIEQADADLGRHLAATIKTGIFCSYSPDPRVPIEWTT